MVSQGEKYAVDYRDPMFPRVIPDPEGQYDQAEATLIALRSLFAHLDTVHTEIKKLLAGWE